MTSVDTPDGRAFGEPDEAVIRRAFDAGLMNVAATSALTIYRDQIVNFIRARVRDNSDACEVYSMFMEDLWRGLPAFEWRCSMRTWSYCLARNAVTRHRNAPARRHGELPVSQLAERSELDAIFAAAPTPTLPYLRDTVKDRFRALWEALSESDQMLLRLRIDRSMAFRDIAITLHGDSGLSEDALGRESARLRKAFERTKVELRRHAIRAGLLDPSALQGKCDFAATAGMGL